MTHIIKGWENQVQVMKMLTKDSEKLNEIVYDERILECTEKELFSKFKGLNGKKLPKGYSEKA